jgi:DNA-binding transcriptional ArsR family regulator
MSSAGLFVARNLSGPKANRRGSHPMAQTLLKTLPAAAPAEFELLRAQARKASDLLKALSHENRLLILCLLTEGEKSVSDLETALGMPQAAVSQHLARLRFDRLVKSRRSGRTVYYSIAGAEIAAIVGSLHDLFCAPVRRDPPGRGTRPTPDRRAKR